MLHIVRRLPPSVQQALFAVSAVALLGGCFLLLR